jgi:hypothetical protein
MMAYLTDISKILADQLTKFATLNRHQLAGQAANLDFWCSEFQHCLEVLDGYKSRFERMKSAETKYAAEHRTVEYHADDPCWFPDSVPTVSPPRRIDHREIQAARQSLCDAMYRFLARCVRESAIDQTRFRGIADRFGTAVEPADLDR